MVYVQKQAMHNSGFLTSETKCAKMTFLERKNLPVCFRMQRPLLQYSFGRHLTRLKGKNRMC